MTSAIPAICNSAIFAPSLPQPDKLLAFQPTHIGSAADEWTERALKMTLTPGGPARCESHRSATFRAWLASDADLGLESTELANPTRPGGSMRQRDFFYLALVAFLASSFSSTTGQQAPAGRQGGAPRAGGRADRHPCSCRKAPAASRCRPRARAATAST